MKAAPSWEQRRLLGKLKPELSEKMGQSTHYEVYVDRLESTDFTLLICLCRGLTCLKTTLFWYRREL